MKIPREGNSVQNKIPTCGNSALLTLLIFFHTKVNFLRTYCYHFSDRPDEVRSNENPLFFDRTNEVFSSSFLGLFCKMKMRKKWVFLISLYCFFSLFRLFFARGRDGNSSENFIPRGIEESRNDKFTFLGDRGTWNLFLGVLREFRGMS